MSRPKKPMTPERIEREYRFSVRFAWAFRAVAVVFGVLLVVLLILGAVPLWMLLYLVFPPLWWWVASSWLSAAESVRRAWYSVLEAERFLDEMKRSVL